MKCRNCGCELDGQAKFCSNCGEKIEKVEKCPHCGCLLEKDVKFCGMCGYSIKPDDKSSLDDKKEDQEEQKENKQEFHVPKFDSDDKKVEQTEMKIRTLELFKEELEKLCNTDYDSKAVRMFFGTGIFCKHLYPLLKNNEKLVALRHIQSGLFGSKYKKEFLAITDERIIKFEKELYFKPHIESCYLSQIQQILAGQSSNVVLGIFAGEKLQVMYSGGKINMRIVGKGKAVQARERIMEEKEKSKNKVPKECSETGGDFTRQSSEHNSTGKGSKTKKLMTMAIIGIGLIVGVSMFWKSSGKGNELSDYIPLARKEVMDFIQKNDMEEIAEDYMYGNEDLAVTLNDNGNIDILIMETPKYSLYGMNVGDSFSLEKDGKSLAEHHYGYLGEYGERMVYGNMSGSDAPGGDRLIAISLDSQEKISKIEFMSSGAQEFLDESKEERTRNSKGLADNRNQRSAPAWQSGAINNLKSDIGILSEEDTGTRTNLQQRVETSSYENWIGDYVDEDGQMISITYADDSEVQLTYTGYSEEGWYTDTQMLSYINPEKTQVSSAYYFEGTLIEETTYTLTGTGIAVIVQPSGGWKEGIYMRQ